MTRSLCLIAIGCILSGVTGCGTVHAQCKVNVGDELLPTVPVCQAMNIDLHAVPQSRSSVGPLPAIAIRIYQLTAETCFATMRHTQSVQEDSAERIPEIVTAKQVTLRPGMRASLSDTMHNATAFVGIVALFDEATGLPPSRLILPIRQWRVTDPVSIEVRDGALALRTR